jgi:hypothetical protein
MTAMSDLTGGVAPEIRIDHPPAGVDRDGVAEVVRGVNSAI